MKNVIQNLKKSSLYLGIFAFSMGVSSCSDDDDGTVVLPETEASISAQAQVVSQNTLLIDEVVVDDGSWLVVRTMEDDGSPGAIINDPNDSFLEEGTHTDVTVELDNSNATEATLEDGDNLILMLHEDDDDMTFEWEGESGADAIVTDASGNAVEATVQVSAPNLSFSDPVIGDTGVDFGNITTNQDGWIVLHNSNEGGAISEDDIIGWTYVPTGDNPDVSVAWAKDFVYTPGQTVYSRFYMDNPADESFTFLDNPAQDSPYFFGFGTNNTITGPVNMPQ